MPCNRMCFTDRLYQPHHLLFIHRMLVTHSLYAMDGLKQPTDMPEEPAAHVTDLLNQPM